MSELERKTEVRIVRSANGFVVMPPYDMRIGGGGRPEDWHVFETEAALLQWLRVNFTGKP